MGLYMSLETLDEHKWPDTALEIHSTSGFLWFIMVTIPFLVAEGILWPFRSRILTLVLWSATEVQKQVLGTLSPKWALIHGISFALGELCPSPHQGVWDILQIPLNLSFLHKKCISPKPPFLLFWHIDICLYLYCFLFLECFSSHLPLYLQVSSITEGLSS